MALYLNFRIQESNLQDIKDFHLLYVIFPFHSEETEKFVHHSFIICIWKVKYAYFLLNTVSFCPIPSII